jgi:ParB family chromosome partitioning protein
MAQKKNDPLAKVMASLAASAQEAPEQSRSRATPAPLVDRENALAAVGEGSRVDKIHRFVDPAVVRPWQHHNRRYQDLTPENCRDLIEGLKAQGQQEFPAIVRRLPKGDAHEYEFICGARRHFAVSWLRENGYPRMRYLIEVRDLTDEEAFRLSDIENRDRQDISDYERARDYLVAVEQYYGGQQKRMAERLEVSPPWLSQFLDLARMPDEILAAFASVHEIRVHHSRTLKPLLKPKTQGALLAKAGELAKIQAARRDAKQAPLKATAVIAELKSAGVPPRKKAVRTSFEVKLGSGEKRAVVTTGAKRLVIEVPALDAISEEAFLDAMREVYTRSAAGG